MDFTTSSMLPSALPVGAASRQHQQDAMASAALEVGSLVRPACYYFSASYRNAEPRVILLVGRIWRAAMRKHYGLDQPHFFCREAYAGEPDTYPNRHPWGWVFRPEAVLQYEQASGMDATLLQHFSELVRQQVASVPFAESACH